MYVVARNSHKNLRTVNGKEINDQSCGDFRIGFALCKLFAHFAEWQSEIFRLKGKTPEVRRRCCCVVKESEKGMRVIEFNEWRGERGSDSGDRSSYITIVKSSRRRWKRSDDDRIVSVFILPKEIKLHVSHDHIMELSQL